MDFSSLSTISFFALVIGSSPGYLIASTHHVSSDLGHYHSVWFCVCHDLNTVMKSLEGFWLHVWTMFLILGLWHDETGLWILWQNITVIKCSYLHTIVGSTWYLCDIILDVIFIPWLRYHLPGFSAVSYLTFSNSSLEASQV